MRLLRVQVPEFRALKDVDISFEPEFTPQVFPLGSLNGGGKSTLLQLIFVLLNYMGNLKIELQAQIQQIHDQIRQNQQDISQYEQSFQYQQVVAIRGYIQQLQQQLQPLQNQQKQQYVINMLATLNISDKETHTLLATITLLFNNKLFDVSFYYGHFNTMPSSGFYTVIHNDIAFYCLINNEPVLSPQIDSLRQEIAKKVFLIAQPNLPYLFLDRNQRRTLFTAGQQFQYYAVVQNVQQNDLPNFLTFDFVDILANVFNKAHSDDAIERTRTGRYGTHVDELEKAINELFIDGKKIVPLIQTTAMTESVKFRLPSGQEIYPEDLSHGELKRLTIFVLLKYKEIQDAIVLIDEIENGFHPDWQYNIVRNLIEWGKNNQYILATHSYELCTALTPAHVKELEPRLIKQE